MRTATIKHNARAINAIRRDPDSYVYWRNSLVNTVWRVMTARTVKGQLQVSVIHPIFSFNSNGSRAWYTVDTNDQIFQQ